ncbi:aspartate/glutamate racemase family protein [Neptunomonas qingdaonensis]|uniref:Aspartate racemase n=1 Tax=Neptunomonas qingdaonensis TaxID=1045558 RepID=A0A1I2RRG7_9GAMM|nr:aspartate/glutamate racemase family protein [Neptunomonas qingdaonensis]SFG40421.1 aspartate racemase [Neptunomonas qingdaonensis]
MRTIGLLGGMSWESTVTYYRLINEGVKQHMGGLHSAKIIMHSVDFQPIEACQHKGDWAQTADILKQAALSVQAGGADFLLICTNTMHKVAGEIEAVLEIPILHIADATAEVLLEQGVKRVGLLGTQFTMEQDFYKGRLTDRFGLQVLIPARDDRQRVHDIIYKELCLGDVKVASKNEYLRIVNQLVDQGAEAIILGCTEIGLLLQQSDTPIKLFDTTVIHAEKAISCSLMDELE